MSCSGRRLKNHIKMFVVVWAALLVSVRLSDADAGALVEGRTSCHVGGFCIILLEEIRAHAGLCVVIPCTFTTDSYFYPQHLVWYKCDQSKQRCGDSDIIFHTNPDNNKVQPGFKGRVSLLESDLRQRNCSIIINDLTESDSGMYQLRVNARYEGFTYWLRTAVYVGDLTQKPTVEVPPLKEGHEAELICTAPGRCSGSDPEITWIWSRAGQNVSDIPGSISSSIEETVPAVSRRHRSTLTFDPSAEHHGTSVTCRVSFANNISTEETVTLNVTYWKAVKIAGNTTVKEGDTLSLTCSVKSFPPSLVSWTKFPNNILRNNIEFNLQNATNFYLQRETGKETLTISNMTAEDSGQYICTAKHLEHSQTEKVDVRVIYIGNLLITGETTVREGHTLNLTCSVKSFPPSRIMWNRLDSNSNLLSDDDLQNNTGSATLVVHNMTRENSEQFVCTAQHQDKTVTLSADVTVAWLSEILDTSGCKVQLDVLTCECISEGVPIPTISWPVLRTHTAYSVLTTVSNHTVNSTVTLRVTDRNPSGLQCVGSNEFGEVKQNLNVQIPSTPGGHISDISTKFPWLEVIIAFLVGALLSAVICCLAVTYCRKKENSTRNLDGTLEMISSQEDPLIDAGQAWDNHTYHHDAAEEGEVAVESAKAQTNGDENKLVYARIDFSKLKRRSPTKAAEERESTETEYSEIKKAKEEWEENGREEGEVLETNEENVMIGEDEEANLVVPEEPEVEDAAVYSNIKEIMDGI